MPKPRTLPMLFRGLDIEFEPPAAQGARADGAGEAEDGLPFSIASDNPTLVAHWGKEKVYEVLSHDPSAVDTTWLKRGLPVFACDKLPRWPGDHDGEHVGIFHGDVEKGKVRGTVRFSRSDRAQDVRKDVDDKIRNQVSVGYHAIRAKESTSEDGKTRTITLTRWAPREVHILPLGADLTVGPGRSSDRDEFPVEFERDGGSVQEDETMTKPAGTLTPTPDGARAADPPQPAPAPAAAAAPAPAPAAAQVAAGAAPAPVTGNRSEEAAEIVAMCAHNGMAARAGDWIRGGLSPQQVGYEILKARSTHGFAAPPAERSAADEKDWSRYSYQRALSILADGGKFDGVEAEVDQELRRAYPSGFETHNGIFLPMRTRTMVTNQATKGAELIQTQPGELIDILRNQAKCLSMGARLMTGLKGPVAFTKLKSGLTVHFVSENPDDDVAESDVVLGIVNMIPKTMQGAFSVSRQFLAQSSVDGEDMMRNDIGAGHSLALDFNALHGPGTFGRPQGVYNAPDVQIQAMGGLPTYGKLVDMVAMVADQNAALGKLGFQTTPLMAGKLMQAPEHATAAPSRWIWTGTIDEGVVAGYRAASTNQVSKTLGAGTNEHGLIFGNWADMIIGLWDSMEVVVDELTGARKALVKFTTFQMGDVAVRRGQSFTKATGATLT